MVQGIPQNFIYTENHIDTIKHASVLQSIYF